VLKSLAGILLGIAGLVLLMALILRKGFWGPLILLGLAVLYFGVTVVSELVKLYGQKIHGRDRHP
jgi:hypothetical protein